MGDLRMRDGREEDGDGMNYVAIDLEMTGLNPKLNHMIEIGAVKVRDGEIVAEFETFVNPGRVLDERITEITGIKDAQLTGAPNSEQAIRMLQEFLGDEVNWPLLGHNILFDYSFLKKEFVNLGEKYEACGIDTLRIARTFLTELSSKTLEALCSYYEIETNSHRAKADAIAAHKVYEHLLHDFGGSENNQSVFEPRQLHFQIKKQRPITARQKERLRKMAERYQYNLPYDVDMLTKNEADRIMDRLRLEFGHAQP